MAAAKHPGGSIMRVPASFAVLLIAAAASAQTDPATVGQWSQVVNWGMTAKHAHMLD
jgi:hypothetical protein